MHPSGFGEVPAETVRVARAAFTKGCMAIRVRDELGSLFSDEQFLDLFAVRGRPAMSPWRLAVVSVLQFTEALPDRQAAEAVRARIDWKYMLGLELTDEGFDASVLCEFRDRMVTGGDTERLLRLLVQRLSAAGLVKLGGRARTDSTHVLAVVRNLNRFELVGEVLRAALEAVAVCAPDWLRDIAPGEWYERYERRVDAYRLPKGEAARVQHAETVGADGLTLWAVVTESSAPPWLAHSRAANPAAGVNQHYDNDSHQLRWRTQKELPAARELIRSPFDPDARYTVKQSTGWVGYKAHLRLRRPTYRHARGHRSRDHHRRGGHRICPRGTGRARPGARDPPGRHRLHQRRSAHRLPPRPRHRTAGTGRPAHDGTGQGQLRLRHSELPHRWDNKQVHCPRGAVSTRWHETIRAGAPFVQTAFSGRDCTPCPVRSQCTRSPKAPPGLNFHGREHLEALQQARRDQQTPQWRDRYKLRTGIEASIAQATGRCGLQRSRYRGQAKTHLQTVLTAAAVNLIRIDAWLAGTFASRTQSAWARH